jgi:hypothetical protein
LHVAAADKARQHGNITSAVTNDETQMGFGHSAALGGANSPFCGMVGMNRFDLARPIAASREYAKRSGVYARLGSGHDR